jgi:hypothetical protein
MIDQRPNNICANNCQNGFIEYQGSCIPCNDLCKDCKGMTAYDCLGCSKPDVF